MSFRAVGSLCGLDLDEFADFGTREQITKALDVLGFQIIKRDIVALARTFVGKSRYIKRSRWAQAPYVVDCSLFTKWLYGQLGVWLPLATQSSNSKSDYPVDASDLKPSDLIFSKRANPIYLQNPELRIGHVALATAEQTVIHAANAKLGVVEESLAVDVVGCKRVMNFESFITLIISSTREVETSDDIRVILIRNYKLLRLT